MTYKVEKASIHDATQIHKLINSFADNGEMLPRSLSEIYENIRDYFVVRQGEHPGPVNVMSTPPIPASPVS